MHKAPTIERSQEGKMHTTLLSWAEKLFVTRKCDDKLTMQQPYCCAKSHFPNNDHNRPSNLLGGYFVTDT